MREYLMCNNRSFINIVVDEKTMPLTRNSDILKKWALEQPTITNPAIRTLVEYLKHECQTKNVLGHHSSYELKHRAEDISKIRLRTTDYWIHCANVDFTVAMLQQGLKAKCGYSWGGAYSQHCYFNIRKLPDNWLDHANTEYWSDYWET